MIGYAQKVLDSDGERFLQHGSKPQAIEAIKPIGEEIVLTALRERAGCLGVHFDRWFREQILYDDGLVDQVLQQAACTG